MLTNDKFITVYNKKMFGRNTMWLRTNISGVNIHGTVKANVGDKTLNTADEFIVRIPSKAFANGKVFIDDKTFRGYSVEELENYFTVQKGDLIVEGIIEDDIQNSGELLQSHNVMTVVSVTNNLSASPYSRHIKVVCK